MNLKSISKKRTITLFLLTITIIINLFPTKTFVDTNTNENNTNINENKKEKVQTVISNTNENNTNTNENKKEKVQTVISKENKIIISKTNNPRYNSNNLRELSNISRERLYEMLKDTPLVELIDVFIRCEEDYKINALFLVGIVALESGYGKSERANNGSNNLTGHAVYNNLSRGSYFSSWEECVYTTTRDLNKNYLTEGGQYYKGLSIKDVNLNYCESSDWYNKINQIISDLNKK